MNGVGVLMLGMAPTCKRSRTCAKQTNRYIAETSAKADEVAAKIAEARKIDATKKEPEEEYRSTEAEMDFPDADADFSFLRAGSDASALPDDIDDVAKGIDCASETASTVGTGRPLTAKQKRDRKKILTRASGGKIDGHSSNGGDEGSGNSGRAKLSDSYRLKGTQGTMTNGTVKGPELAPLKRGQKAKASKRKEKFVARPYPFPIPTPLPFLRIPNLKEHCGSTVLILRSLYCVLSCTEHAPISKVR